MKKGYVHKLELKWHILHKNFQLTKYPQTFAVINNV